MEDALTDEKSRMQNIAEGLALESKKSLKMEAALDKQNIQFDSERDVLKNRLKEEEKQTSSLKSEVSRLSQQVEMLQKQLLSFSRSSSPSIPPNSAQPHSSSSPPHSTNPAFAGKAGSIPQVVASTAQSVSSNPNNFSSQSYSIQPSAPNTVQTGRAAGSGASLAPSRGSGSKTPAYSKSTPKVVDGGRIGSGSPEREVIYKEGLTPSNTVSTITRRISSPNSGSGVSREVRMSPVGAPIPSSQSAGVVERVDLDVGIGSKVVNVTPGTSTTVTHTGGRISFHVGGAQGQQAPQSPVSQGRKHANYSPMSGPLNRGVPPPIPPNKPNFAPPHTGNANKPSPPAKGSVVTAQGVVKDGSHYSNTQVKAHPPGLVQQRAVQIPVNVVTGTSSPVTVTPTPPNSQVASVRTQVRENSPSAVRKASQVCVNAK